jgi:hypothetical protein
MQIGQGIHPFAASRDNETDASSLGRLSHLVQVENGGLPCQRSPRGEQCLPDNDWTQIDNSLGYLNVCRFNHTGQRHAG